MERITARTNPLMQHMKKLGSDGAYRHETGLFLCDSPKLLGEAVRWGAEIVEVAFSEDMTPDTLPKCERMVQIPRDVMASISPMKTPLPLLLVAYLCIQ